MLRTLLEFLLSLPFLTLQYSVPLRNAMLDQIETVIGASAILEIRSGAPPANCAAADSGTLLASLALPASWLAAAAAGAVSMSGVWQDPSANAAGVAGHFRIKDNGGTVTGMQGTVTGSGGGGDMELSNTNIALAQPVSITSFTITGGNA